MDVPVFHKYNAENTIPHCGRDGNTVEYATISALNKKKTP